MIFGRAFPRNAFQGFVFLLILMVPSLHAHNPADHRDSGSAKSQVGQTRSSSANDKWSAFDDFDDDNDEWFLSPLELLANEPYPGEPHRSRHHKIPEPTTPEGWKKLAKEHKKNAQKYLEKSYDEAADAEKYHERAEKRKRWAKKAEKEGRFTDQSIYERQAKTYEARAKQNERDAKLSKAISNSLTKASKKCEEKGKELEKKQKEAEEEKKKKESDD